MQADLLERCAVFLKRQLVLQKLPKWLLVLVLLYPVHWDGIYITRTRDHYKCLFLDGSYAEHKETYKWFFYNEILPHVQTQGGGIEKSWYVNSKGKRYDEMGNFGWSCDAIGKRDGRYGSKSAFEDNRGNLIREYDVEGKRHAIWVNLPEELGVSRPNGADKDKDRLESFAKREFLTVHRPWLVSAVADANTHLLAEQPLVVLEHPTTPFNTVRFVYQTESHDMGKTWSPPKLTRDAKYFEVDKTMSAQIWKAKFQAITDQFPTSE